MQADINKIINLIEDYFTMLHTADNNLAEKIFCAEARVNSSEDNKIISIDLDGFKKRMHSRPIPKEIGEEKNWELISLDFAASDLAHIKLRSVLLSKIFIDYLTVFKINGNWKIICKNFHSTPI